MAIVSDQLVEDRPRLWSPRYWLRWRPTSLAALAQAEKRILSHVWSLIDSKFVTIANGSKSIRTIALNTSSKATPLVLLHGMGSGVGLWALNLGSFCEDRPVYAFDMLGFGRSSRVKFSRDAMLAEMELVEAMEEWRREMNIPKFVLLGHSMGGFLAASYALRYPQNLHHLVLVDPWGFPEQPAESERRTPIPTWIRAVAAILSPFNPLAGLRVAGPWGPSLVERIRPDLLRKFEDLYDDNTVAQYIYHCNAQDPSGETAFKNMTLPYGWAKFPMVRRIKDIQADIPITMVYGSRSWIDSSVGYEVKYLRQDSYVDVQVVRGSGHHVYADKADEFNNLVRKVCRLVDSNLHRSRQNSTTLHENMRSDSASDSNKAANATDDSNTADFDDLTMQESTEMEIEQTSQFEVSPSVETSAVDGQNNRL